MNQWYLLLAFVAGISVGQHMTIRRLERVEEE